MNKVVQLVNEWDIFEQSHPGAEIEDFCRYYLIQKRETVQEGQIAGGIIPPQTTSLLMKLIGRICYIFAIYARIGFEGMELQMEDFAFLNSIMYIGESKKTDIINYNLTELSTGMDILNRLKKTGLISERTAPSDRRSKLVQITSRGEIMLIQSYERLRKVGDIMFHDVPEDDKKLCIQLLKNVEIQHSKRCIEYKNKTLDEIYREECGEAIPSQCAT